MHILIDLQGAQCESRFRGIGRYSLSIAKAIARNRGDHRVSIALNSVFSDSVDLLKAEFEEILPAGSVHVWRGLESVHGRDPANAWRRQASERIFEAFLAGLQPDVVLVSSLFEGFADDAVSSVPAQPRRFATGVILYDLIPLIFRESYLTNKLVSNWYARKLENLTRADFLLAISASSGREAEEHLGFAGDRIVNISGAADPKFRKIEVRQDESERLKTAYRISRPFVLCAPGGFDHHKNVDGLIRAWALLPERIRNTRQLVIASRVQKATQRRLDKIRQKAGLGRNDVVFTGYVPDADLIRLYNLTELCVFPSRHEGFGLPALEAMSCGAPTIGSNSSAVPEVIGREDAMFAPEDAAGFARLVEDLLEAPDRRAELSRFALERAPLFSWDKSALLAIAGMERLAGERAEQPEPASTRPDRLAIVAPTSDLRGGAAHRLLALLPHLSWRYRIDIVAASDSPAPSRLPEGATACLSIEAFRASADRYDRILYCIGDTASEDVIALAQDIPGAVLVTDAGLAGRLDGALEPDARVRLLRNCHGFVDFEGSGTPPSRTMSALPLVHDIASRAVGVLAGSESVSQAAQAAGLPDAADWPVVPFTHVAARTDKVDRTAARRRLGLDDGVPVLALLCVPAFDAAFLEAVRTASAAAPEGTRLLLLDPRGSDERNRLAGKLAAEGFGNATVALVDPGHPQTAAMIAGAVDGALAFGALVDASASGLALDLADAGLRVVAAAAAPSASEAVDAALHGKGAGWHVARPAPSEDLGAATAAFEMALERIYAGADIGLHEATRAIAAMEGRPEDRIDWGRAAEALALTFPATGAPRQLLVDVSELSQRDARSGVQRVVRNILRYWLQNPPAGYQVQPVYATPDRGYRYATRFTLDFLGQKAGDIEDTDIDFAPGDIFVMLDLQHHIAQLHRDFYQVLRHHGVKVYFIVHDLLPILLQGIFPHHMKKLHEDWLSVVAESDGAFCVSRAVANELADWIRDTDRLKPHPFHIGWFHHGSDFTGSKSWTGLPAGAEDVLKTLESRPTFLMVGTLEPRKGHAQTLDAFEALWAKGVDVNLAIVGKEGWLIDDLVGRLRRHKERGKRLFWLEGVSDEYLERTYAASVCLIAASRGEGFGLPLIEAAQYRLPIVARDIPVFREVAGDHAYFFTAADGAELAAALEAWLALYREGKHPTSDAMPRLTWEETAGRLVRAIIEDDYLIELRQPRPEVVPGA